VAIKDPGGEPVVFKDMRKEEPKILPKNMAEERIVQTTSLMRL